MYVSHIKLKNWRNFTKAEVDLAETTYLLGPNAAGKSNFMDVFRFLRDVCKTQGGGLQKAIEDRGGIKKIRCLHARQDPEVEIEIHLKHELTDKQTAWRYILAFKNEAKGLNRTMVTKEIVWEGKKRILNRPEEASDKNDYDQLTDSHLEQKNSNKKFREIAEFFNDTTYLHLVPQLLKFADVIGGRVVEDDPFGQGFLERIARETKRVRDSRLNRIQKALSSAVPQFENLKYEQDSITGRPHLEARYKHFRPNAGWQREEQFSDGTLRLIGLLWSLMESNSLLLLEEPELSLNDGIVEQIPLIFEKMRKLSKRSRQILISTHSEALLSNQGIDPLGVLRLEPTKDGTVIHTTTEEDMIPIEAGFSVAQVILPRTKPSNVGQLAFSF